MIYLVSKIIVSLLGALGIGFGMAWMLQMHLAARLREQLNSVIFETKSRIPQLESEITNRDQTIDGLREDLVQQSKNIEPVNNQAGSKEQEKQIDELRQQVIDLENELKAARSTGSEEAVFEIAEADRAETEEPELMSDDEFLTDIQDIFEDADDSVEVFGTDSHQPQEQDGKASAEEAKQSIEEELQNELEGWDDNQDSEPTAATGPITESEASDQQPDKTAKPPKRSGPVDLKAELLELEGKIRDDEGNTATDAEQLHSQIEELTEARKSLSDVVDTQAKEIASMQQQRDLQDKSLNVLNQQLELARMANERILRELRELKDSKPATGDAPRSATGI